MPASTRTYVKVARAAGEERTRDALMNAAEDILFNESWTGASLDAIAARAGVTKQTLLRHFGSKEGLLAEAAARTRDEISEQRFAAPVGDVAGTIDNLLEHYDAYGERSRTVGALGGDGALAEVATDARQLHYDWVEHVFSPWLDELRGRARARLRGALIAACDLQTWWILSHDLGLEPREVRTTLIMTVNRLLEEET